MVQQNYHLDLGKRLRAHTAGFYNEDDLFRSQVTLGKMANRKEAPPKPTPPRKMPRSAASPSFSDFQFFDQARIEQLYAKRREWWVRHEKRRVEIEELKRREIERHGPSYKGGGSRRVGEIKIDGGEVDRNEGLTVTEASELESKMSEGFGGWGQREYGAFKKASEKYGRKDYASIAGAVGRGVDEVARYASVFWSRGEGLLRNWASTVAAIERGEEVIARRLERVGFVRGIVARYQYPLQDLKIEYRKSVEKRPWTGEIDRFLLCAVAKLGYGKWREILGMCKEAWTFRFDWFLLSRTPAEIKSRCDQARL